MHLSSTYKVISDIELSDTRNWNSGSGFKPIGNSVTPFQGQLDGQGFSLSFLYINSTNLYTGLLGRAVGPGLAIEAVRLVGFDVRSTAQSLGTLAGYISAGVITDCHAVGGQVAGANIVGGLVGYGNEDITIEDSSSSAEVSGSLGGVGGLVGHFDDSAIPVSSLLRSFATGNVVSMAAGSVGGLIGRISTSVQVTDSYATGNVHSDSNDAGGLIGRINSGAIDRSYAVGNVYAAAGNAGGLVGLNSIGAVSNSFSTGNVAVGAGNSGGLIGFRILNPTASRWFNHPFNPADCYQGGNTGCTAQTNPTWFYTKTNYDAAGLNWDFTSSGAWIMPATGKYPVLRWQNPNRPIEFPPEFRNGRKIGYSDMAAYRVWGFCGTPGETISFGGPNAPANTTCNGGTFTTNWDFSGQSDGSIDITVQQGTATPVTRRLVKDTDSCVAGGLNDETVGGTIDTRFTGGGPHIVCNVQQMERIRSQTTHWTKSFTLGANISLSAGYGNGTIGTSGTNYSGTFDGDGFFLDRLTLTIAGNGVGLFGYTNGGTISNIGMERVTISGQYGTGSLVGVGNSPGTALSNSYSTGFVAGTSTAGGLYGEAFGAVSDCFSTADVVGSSGVIGGLLGYHQTGTVTRSFAAGDVRGAQSTGGFVGVNFGLASIVTASYATGSVSGVFPGSDEVGGFIGGLDNTIVQDSYSTGSVYGGTGVGGFAGAHYNADQLMHVYASGDVFGSTNVGGVLGESYAVGSPLTNLFSVSHVTAVTSNGGALVGGTSVTLSGGYWYQPLQNLPCVGDGGTVTLCQQATALSQFQSASSAPLSAWDFSTIWKFPTTGGLPILQWQEEE